MAIGYIQLMVRKSLVVVTCGVALFVALVAEGQQTDSAAKRSESSDPYFNPRLAGSALPMKRSESAPTNDHQQLSNNNSSSPLMPTVRSDTRSSGGDFRPGSAANGNGGDFVAGGQSTRLQPQVQDTNPLQPRTTETTPLTPEQTPTAKLSVGNRNVSTPGAAFEPGRILAIVGGEPIFVSDLIVEANQIIDQFIAGAPAEIKARERNNLIPRLLQKYVDSKLVYVEFKQGLPAEANLEDIIESAAEHFDDKVLPKMIEASNVKSAAELDAHFRAQGSSLRRVRQSWSENELIKYTMQEKLKVNDEVTHQELYERYQADRESYRVKAQARWEQIMVRFDNYPTRDDAWNAIAEMGNKVILGASFTAVAKNHSHGFLAEEGGQQGWTNEGSLANKTLDKAVFDIEVNKLSDIIETDKGYHIIRVLERNAAGFVPFTDAQVEIKEKILSEKREQEYRDYVNSLREKIPVEIFEEVPQTAAQDDSTSIK